MSQTTELGTLLADIRQKTKSREFAQLSLEQKEFELEAYLKNLYQALGGANDPNQEGIKRVIQHEIEELSPRIYHGKDIDYSLGILETSINSAFRGFTSPVTSAVTYIEQSSRIEDGTKFNADNRAINITVDNWFPINPDHKAANAYGWGLGLVLFFVCMVWLKRKFGGNKAGEIHQPTAAQKAEQSTR